MKAVDQQVNLQKVLQAKDVAKGEAFEKALNEELFPIDKLSCNWKSLVKLAINKSAPISHRLPLKDFAKVVACDPSKKLSLFQFGVLSNALETVSPDTLSLIDEDYETFMDEAVAHIEWYQKRVRELRDEIQLQIDKEFQMKDAALNGKGGGLKPVIGQA